MQHILARQIKSRRDFRQPSRFFVTLLLHEIGAGISELDPSIRMNAIIDASVARNITSSHARIRCVHDGIASKRCNIALPKIYSLFDRRKFCQIRNAFCLRRFRQIFILHLQKIFADFPRQPDITKAPKKHFLFLRIFWYFYVFVSRLFLKKRVDKILSSFCLFHITTFSAVVAIIAHTVIEHVVR